MILEVGKYLLSVSAASVLLSLTQALLPRGSVRNVAGFMGGLLIVLAVLSPIIRLDYEKLIQYTEDIRIQTNAAKFEAETINRSVMSDIIKEQCQAYVLDKAGELNMEVTADITLSEEGVYPEPVSVKITGEYTMEQKQKLSLWIEQDLGLTAQQQEWK